MHNCEILSGFTIKRVSALIKDFKKMNLMAKVYFMYLQEALS